MKMLEIPFEELNLELLWELQRYGLEAIVDGDDRVLRVTSVIVMDTKEIHPQPSFGSPN